MITHRLANKITNIVILLSLVLFFASASGLLFGSGYLTSLIPPFILSVIAIKVTIKFSFIVENSNKGVFQGEDFTNLVANTLAVLLVDSVATIIVFILVKYTGSQSDSFIGYIGNIFIAIPLFVFAYYLFKTFNIIKASRN